MTEYSPSLVQVLPSLGAAASAHADLCDLLHECADIASKTAPDNCHGKIMMLRCALIEAVMLAESLCPEDVRALPLQ